ncbi:cupin domain-containing protein [Streptomyces sp. NPDC056049]|uniref:cupin domain-containing protein n=1 Tax=Streptomyces sp. NPDC056049 TaxID=3345693 RepID=UPI0035D6FABC
MTPSETTRAVTRARVSNLHEGLLRAVTADHDGIGTIHVHRAFDRMRAPAGVAFIDLVVMPPGTSIGTHRHGDDEETYVILSGRGRMVVDGEEFAVGPGDVVVNRPYGEHGLTNDSGTDSDSDSAGGTGTDLHLLVFELAPIGGAR